VTELPWSDLSSITQPSVCDVPVSIFIENVAGFKGQVVDGRVSVSRGTGVSVS